MTKQADELSKIAKILGAKHYAKEMKINPTAPAAQDWYIRVELYDEDYEQVIGYSFRNVTKELKAIHAYARQQAERAVREELEALLAEVDHGGAARSLSVNKIKARLNQHLGE